MKKLVILDRDGVINYDSDNYIKSPEEWIPIPGSLEAIAQLNKAGYLVAIATNQSGIGRNLFDEKTLSTIHEKMKNALSGFGGHIDGIFYCPHVPEDECGCRKPKPGLFKIIAEHFQCSLTGTPAIGDSWRDVETAFAVGCKPILVRTGKFGSISEKQIKLVNTPVFPDVFPDLAVTVEAIISHLT